MTRETAFSSSAPRASSADSAPKIAVVLAFLGVVFVNYLAGTGQINGTTPGEISDRFFTPLTPAGYAFSIWSVIYLGLAAFCFRQWRRDDALFSRIRPLFLLNMAANASWIFLWHFEQIPLSLAPMLVILGTLLQINRLTATGAPLWTTKVVFNVYFAWICVASIVNAFVVLVFLGAQIPELLAAGVALFAAFLGVGTRRKLGAPAFALTVAWALFAVGSAQGFSTLIGGAATLGALACLVAVPWRSRVVEKAV